MQRSRSLGIVGLLLGIFLGTLSNQIVNVPLKQVMSDLHLTIGQGALVVISFNIAFAVLMPIAGWAGQRVGRKRIYLLSLCLAGLGSIGASFAPSLVLLVGFRLLQGAGSACILPNVMTLITDVVGPERRGRALGLWATANGLGYALGPPAGGWLTDAWSWRAIFVPSAVLALVALLLCARHLPPFPGHTLGLDWRGAGGLTAGSLLLLVAAVAVPQLGPQSPLVWMTAIASVPGFALFGYSATHLKRPFVPVGTLKDPDFVVACVSVGAQMFCLGATVLAVSLFLTRRAHLDFSVAGAYIFMVSVTMAGLAPVAGWVTERVGYMLPLSAGAACIAASQLLLTWRLGGPAHVDLGIPVLLAFVGAGVAFVQTPGATAANSSPAGVQGAALGVFNLVRFAGSALGGAWVAVALQVSTSYSVVFGICALVGTAALLITLARARIAPAAPVKLGIP